MKVETPKNKTWYPNLKITDYKFIIYDIDADAVIHEFEISNKNEFRYALKVLKYHREVMDDNVFLDVQNKEYQRIGEEYERR